MADYYHGVASLGEIKDLARLTQLQGKLAAANEAVLAAFVLVSKAKAAPRPRRRIAANEAGGTAVRELQGAK